MRNVVSWIRSRLPAGPEVPAAEGLELDDRYTVQSLLGRGGSSLVFLARQRSMGRPVALKVLNAQMVKDDAARRRFLRELRAVSRLKSPHTISVFDGGTTGEGIPWIAMELLRGKSLYQEMCDSPGPMGVDRAVNLVDQALDSLAEAHSAGVLHRDLKPENLFLLPGQTGTEFVKVLDFGIAQLADDPLGRETEIGMVLGTPRYMSPEQASGKRLDGRSDLYSLALILFELLTGRFPFEAPTPVAVALQKMTKAPPVVHDLDPRSRVPAALEAFLRQALSRDPSDRPADAAAFRAGMLAAVGAPEAAGAAPASPSKPAARPGDRRDTRRETRMVSLRFRLAGRECRATSLDVSSGGAFLFSRDLPRLGARIRFACPDPDAPGDRLHLSGEVVRVVEQPSVPGQVEGFAVRWLLADGTPAPATWAGLLALHRPAPSAGSRVTHHARPAA